MKATDKIIEEMTAANAVFLVDARQQHLFRESLRNLVRLAKAEQLQEMRLDVARVLSPANTPASMKVAPQ